LKSVNRVAMLRIRLKGGCRVFKKSSNFDSVVKWDVAEDVEKSGEWMI
jgi:hypothetical protein